VEYDRSLTKARANFRFYEELNEHLPVERRKRTFSTSFRPPSTVEALIQALGVPPAEVDLILVNGESVGAAHLVSDGDRVSVYPMFESFDISPLVKLRNQPLRRVRFAVDEDLLRLGHELRRLGFDTWFPGQERASVAEAADQRGRVLLTRDPAELQRPGVTHGLLVREPEPAKQLDEVVRRLDLAGHDVGREPRCPDGS